MNSILTRISLFFITTLLSVSDIVFAQPAPAKAASKNFMNEIFESLFTPILGLLSMGALVYFLFGFLRFFYDKDQSEESRSKLKVHMTWGLVGLFIIFSIGGIVTFISSFGSAFK